MLRLNLTEQITGWNSSVGCVLGLLSCLMQRHGFDPPLRRIFSGRRDFSLGVNMGSHSIPPKTLSDESINQGLVCTHMHTITQTQKILTFMSQTGECRQQKHTQHAPSTKMERDCLNRCIKNRSHTPKSRPNGEPQRYSWAMQKKNRANWAFSVY